jgi:NADH dehydrogenase [ubiquinone] 1 alpha subcomplex assembly factor 6
VKGETTQADTGADMRGISAVGALVRQHDPDRYRAALFAPSGRREALFALYAFNYEVARVRESVSQPMLGQIRLQWWREVIDAAYSGAPARRHVVAAPLTAIIREHPLSREWFDRLIDAREQDLTDAPPATLAALDDYAAATSAALVHLALQILGFDPKLGSDVLRATAQHVGIAYALTGLLRALPFHARAGRCYIPQDLAARSGLDPHGSRLHDGSSLRQAVEEIAERAAEHLRRARQQRRRVPRAALPAFLPAIVADRGLARLQRAAWNPFDPAVAAPDPLLTWRLMAAMLRRRF